MNHTQGYFDTQEHLLLIYSPHILCFICSYRIRELSEEEKTTKVCATGLWPLWAWSHQASCHSCQRCLKMFESCACLRRRLSPSTSSSSPYSMTTYQVTQLFSGSKIEELRECVCVCVWCSWSGRGWAGRKTTGEETKRKQGTSEFPGRWPHNLPC